MTQLFFIHLPNVLSVYELQKLPSYDWIIYSCLSWPTPPEDYINGFTVLSSR
jgi:hypothetical protein